MRVKSAAVSLKDCCFELGYALGVASRVYRQFNAKLTVTSLNDAKHSTGSLHYAGKAADLRTRDLSGAVLNLIVIELRHELEPRGFDVVNEGDHIHIEYQPKAGEKFLEVVG